MGFYDTQENHGHFCVLTKGKINAVFRRINLESHTAIDWSRGDHGGGEKKGS